jgi:hypothetical protein
VRVEDHRIRVVRSRRDRERGERQHGEAARVVRVVEARALAVDAGTVEEAVVLDEEDRHPGRERAHRLVQPHDLVAVAELEHERVADGDERAGRGAARAVQRRHDRDGFAGRRLRGREACDGLAQPTGPRVGRELSCDVDDACGGTRTTGRRGGCSGVCEAEAHCGSRRFAGARRGGIGSSPNPTPRHDRRRIGRATSVWHPPLTLGAPW